MEKRSIEHFNFKLTCPALSGILAPESLSA